MHKSAIHNCKTFIDKHIKSNKILSVLDVGSQDLNGSLRSLFQKNKFSYTGIDMVGGKNVDVVLKDPHIYPFKNSEFDIVVSSSCFEHDEMFWLSFKEIIRVTKNDGWVYLNAPHKDGQHRCPVDCWRFCPDGFKSFSKWCPEALYIEGYIDDRPHRDCVGIFKVKKA